MKHTAEEIEALAKLGDPCHLCDNTGWVYREELVTECCRRYTKEGECCNCPEDTLIGGHEPCGCLYIEDSQTSIRQKLEENNDED